MGKYTTLSHEKRFEAAIEDCITIYLEVHPEMVGIHISKNKMFYEMIRFYLEGTSLDLNKTKRLENE